MPALVGDVDQDDIGCLSGPGAGNVNNDGNVDQDDVSAVINTVGGGGCP